MNQWLPSSKKQWIAQAAVFALLLGVAYQYATASATARALQLQLDAALDSVEVAADAHEVQIAVSDSLIALQDSAQAADTAAVNAVAVASDATASETSRALAEAREAAAGLPVVQAALDRAEDALVASEEARLEERATSAAALFSSQQRERTLGRQLEAERGAAATEILRLNDALSLSIQESEAWERAAKPGALTQVWKQGRAAAIVLVLALAIK